jgi:hypothetical protein
MGQALTDINEIVPIIFGGKAIFTLRSTATGNEYTYLVSTPKQGGGFLVKLLTGPDNLRNYTYIGMIVNRTFKLTRGSRLTKDAPSVKAFEWTFNSYMKGHVPSTAEFYPSDRCARCGKVLTKTASVVTGFGPECAEKIGVAYATMRHGQTTENKSAAPKPNTYQTPVQRTLATAAEIADGIGKLLGEPTEGQVEAAAVAFKRDFPEDYYQDDLLTEGEAWEVAKNKFRHELARG